MSHIQSMTHSGDTKGDTKYYGNSAHVSFDRQTYLCYPLSRVAWQEAEGNFISNPIILIKRDGVEDCHGCQLHFTPLLLLLSL